VSDAEISRIRVVFSRGCQGRSPGRRDQAPRNRRARRRSVGGKIEAFYFCFGDQDAIIIAELPDAASAAAVSLAVSSTGAARLTTTPLITVEEMDHAAGKKTAYRAPGA